MRYRMTPGVDYQPIPELVKSLLVEQGYICAYCMRRIPHKDKLYKKNGQNYVLTDEDHRVEHMKSRELHDDLKLNYNNMVVCCPGHIGDEDHCDRLKGSKDISFSPTNQHFIDTISYQTDGTICSSNQTYDSEMNNILNLNTKLLKQNRKQARDSVITQITVMSKTSGWNKNALNLILSKYENMHNDNGNLIYYPYCGIITWYIKKKLSRLP